MRIPDQIRGLTVEEKRDLLRNLLTRKLQNTAPEYPLSYGQRAMLFLHKMDPEMASYNVVIPARATPPLDADAFERALQGVVARHETLQMIVAPGDAEPVQKRASVSVGIQIHKRLGSTPTEIHSEALGDCRRAFALEQDLPIRASVYRLGDEDIILITAHHLAFDAWSAHVLLQDLRTLYAKEMGERAPDLQPLTARYRDFVLWQRRMLDQEGDAHWEYWSARLSGNLPVLRLRSQKPRPSTNTFTGGSIPIAIDQDVLNGLRSLARQHKATLFAVVLAAWASLLALLSADDEVVVGVPVSGRTRPEWSNVVGYFVNTLPVRLRVRPAENFLTHLCEAAEGAQEALAHQDYPFPLIVDRLKVRHDSTHSPVYQTVLNVHRVPPESDLSLLYLPETQESVRFGPSRLRPYPVVQQEGQFDLVLELMESRESLTGKVKFSNDALLREEALRIADQFLSFLREAVLHPKKPIGAIGTAANASDETPGDEWDEVEV